MTTDQNPKQVRNSTLFLRQTGVKPSRWIVACALLAALAGCGGGGGGASLASKVLGDACVLGSDPGVVQYTTVWGTGTPLNASQVLQIVDSDGNVVRTDAINRSSAARSTLNIAGVVPGVYELRATLWDAANAAGAELGVVSQVVDLCGKTAFVRTTADQPASAIRLSPGSIGLLQQRTRRFIATPLSVNGYSVFVPAGDITWSVIGGVGTITQSGAFTASTVGTGAVQASLPALAAQAQVVVSQFIVTQTKWTILVYINAANDLAPFSDLNVNQMETVAGNPDVRFVLQWKQSRAVTPGSSFDGVRRYLVTPDSTGTIVSQVVQSDLVDGQGRALDMGRPETLNDFIVWGKTFYPADRYILILWNHGNGWRRTLEQDRAGRAFSYDDETGSSIQMWEVDAALAGQHFDIIAWDASLMQMLESGYELRSYADYMVGSQESPPAEGYPYDLVFAPFRDGPDATTAALTKAFVDGMLANPIYVNRKITQSSIDTAQLAALKDSVSAFAQTLIDNQAGMVTQIQNVRANAKSYSPTSQRVFRDLAHVCELFEAEPGVPAAVVAAAADVRAKIAAAVVWEGHNTNSLNSNGLAIDFSPASTFVNSRTDYIRLKLAIDSLWDEWLSVAP